MPAAVRIAGISDPASASAPSPRASATVTVNGRGPGSTMQIRSAVVRAMSSSASIGSAEPLAVSSSDDAICAEDAVQSWRILVSSNSRAFAMANPAVAANAVTSCSSSAVNSAARGFAR